MAPVVRGNSLNSIVPGPSWTQAEANAVKLGGHLTAITSQEENDFVASFSVQGLEPKSGNFAGSWGRYIGLTDVNKEGLFSWVNGENLNYQNWYPNGEPNSYSSWDAEKSDFVEIFPVDNIGIKGVRYPGRWNDSYGQGENSTTGIAETPFIRRGDSAYVVVQGPTWEEAEANAVKLGGHLVTINDAAENEWISSTFKQQLTLPDKNWGNGLRAGAWIGLNDRLIDGQPQWSDGSSVSYTNFVRDINSKGASGTIDGWLSVMLDPSGAVQSYAGLNSWHDVPINEKYDYWLYNYGIAEIKLAPNNAPTGTPTITGTAKVGSTLTIDASAIKDTDNFTGYTPTYNYSFEVSNDNGVTWTKLTFPDATDNNSTYTLTTAEVGKQVRGVVSYLDGYGTNEVVNTATSVKIEAEFKQPIIRGNSLYTIVPGPSWTQAEANAVKVGGHLVTIDDKYENTFISDFFGSESQSRHWLGLTRDSYTSPWKWVSGQSLNYANWDIGEPNSPQSESHNYAHIWTASDWFTSNIRTQGTWNDTFLNTQLQGIAETPFIRRGDSAYVIVQGPTWEEAEANAIKLGGHLVTINDAAENEWIANTFGNKGVSGLWIGLTDKDQEGSWKWISNEINTYTRWISGEPNNANYSSSGEDYVHLWSDNSWKWAGVRNLGYWNDAPNDPSVWSEGRTFAGLAEIKLAPNNAPTGTPTITGTAKVGSTLTIDASAIKDSDNFNGYTPTYQYAWETSADGTTWTKLTSTDATDNNTTYALTTAEVGKQVRGVVSYLDGYGTNEAVNSVSSVVLPNNPPTQEVFTNKSQIAYTPSKSVTVPLQYKTSTGDSQLSGLTLNVHYNSSILTPTTTNNGVSDQLPVSITTNKIVPDTNNLDNDPLTDKIIQLVWATFDNTFPNKTLPTTLANLTFNTSSTTKDTLTGAPLTTTLRYTASETASGYDFLTNSTILKASTFNLDVDGDGQVKALTDGLMIIRKLLGPAFDGEALTFKAIGSGATRSTEEIHTYIQGAVDGGMLDVDKNNKTTALTDGLMVIRRLLGPAFDGDALTFKALASDSPYFGKSDAPALVSANIDSLRSF